MKNNLHIVLLFIAILSAHQAEAQFFKKLQKKIEDKIERKIEDKADRKSDQVLDSVFADNPSKRRKNKSKQNDNQDEESTEVGGFNLGDMMEAAMNRKPAEYETSYTFDLTTTMEIKTEGSKPMTMTTSYGDGSHYIEMGKGVSMINDYKNEAMITINEDKKTAQAMSLSLLKMFDKGAIEMDEADAEITVDKTGKTKTVSGYHCQQYIIKGKDFNSEGWFTKDINFDMVAHAQSMSEMFKSASSTAILQKEVGFPMEMTTTTKNKEVMVMKVLHVSESKKTIDLSGYTVSQL